MLKFFEGLSYLSFWAMVWLLAFDRPVRAAAVVIVVALFLVTIWLRLASTARQQR